MKDFTRDETADRKAWMGLLARSDAADVLALWDQADLATDHQWLRAPEVGGVMVRGRAGATGAAFNLGEMTVTRCALKLADGRVGHAMVQGRDKRKAEVAALCDALMQGAEADAVRDAILTPLADMAQARRAARAARAAATKVDFFTMVRGE
ncbi:phosphonate C-P lyase system protein PhnG [Pseudooceanicola sp. MF1-13]|uniref:phosphonate C-P lyase system protein PhnG n=1 Tax=Pseudooceanicola sp. MF1-13 TaxID=3379095 RepID=UPI0038929B88